MSPVGEGKASLSLSELEFERRSKLREGSVFTGRV